MSKRNVQCPKKSLRTCKAKGRELGSSINQNFKLKFSSSVTPLFERKLGKITATIQFHHIVLSPSFHNCCAKLERRRRGNFIIARVVRIAREKGVKSRYYFGFFPKLFGLLNFEEKPLIFEFPGLWNCYFEKKSTEKNPFDFLVGNTELQNSPCLLQLVLSYFNSLN